MDSNLTQAALDAGRQLAQVQRVAPDGIGAPTILVPSDWEAQVLDLSEVEAWLPKPVRKRGEFSFGEVDSFIRFFNEQKDANSRIFATITDTGGSFRGVLNFQGTDPSFNDHVCTHTLQATKEWAAWVGSDKKRMSQCDFATFLEENAALFTDPKGADLLELIQSLEGHANVSINQAVKLQTGAIKIRFDEDVVLKGVSTTRAGEMDVPSILNVSVAPFRGVPNYALKARLRYRVESRKISFWYETVDAHMVIREVCRGIMDTIKEKTGLDAFVS